MIRCNANLFRAAAVCISNEETRPYLSGVYIESHTEKGVTLTATDGHRLIVVHDENGVADAPAFVRLSARALKACKTGRKEDHRILSIEGDTATIFAFVTAEEDEPGTPVAVSADCLVDGTYPDYRRVIPSEFSGEHAVFNGDYLAAFADVGKMLRPASRDGAPLSIRHNGESPALITWGGVAHAFGILMPMRADKATFPTNIPAWLQTPAPSVAPDANEAEELESV